MTTVDDVLCEAKRLIANFGWKRNAWPKHGPSPRCIRCAITCAAQILESPDLCVPAFARVSEAIYGRGSVGGICDYEHYKRVQTDNVLAVLQKAIEIGPAPAPEHARMWPT